MALPPKAAQRYTPADDLSQASEVRVDAKQLLRAPQGQPEASHDLVEDQQTSSLPRNAPQTFEISRRRRYTAHISHHRFHDHAGDLVLMLREGLLNRRQIVKGQRKSPMSDLLRHTGRSCQAKGGQSRSRFHQQAVRMPVIAALELNHVLAIGKRPRHADGGHGCFCPRTHEAQFLDRGHGGNHQFRQVGFGGGRGAKACAPLLLPAESPPLLTGGRVPGSSVPRNRSSRGNDCHRRPIGTLPRLAPGKGDLPLRRGRHAPANLRPLASTALRAAAILWNGSVLCSRDSV